MNIKELLIILFDEISKILSGENKFTGKITFEINCRDGGIGNCNMSVNKSLSNNARGDNGERIN